MSNLISPRARVLVLALALSLGFASPAFAHCDGLDGPVVTQARTALDAGKVELGLPWVPQRDEAQIRHAFEHALAVRKLSPEARSLADTFFFETLVRVHRASEGAPYTGLKPAGRDLGPAIPAADRALETGSTAAIEALLDEAWREGLHDRFAAAKALADYDRNDVAAGRRYVAAYVAYVHYVEGLWNAASTGVEGHYPEAPAHGHAE
jgi:hypothetical protein